MDEKLRALIYAIKYKSADECRRLILEGADARARLDGSGSKGGSLLHLMQVRYLGFGGSWIDPEKIRVLIEAGADPASRDDDGVTPLHLAAELDYDVVCQILIEAGADIEARDSNGSTPLHRAAALTHRGEAAKTLPKACAVLLAAGADPNALDGEGRTPLHLAAGRGTSDNCRALVEAGADPNARDDEGRTPLILAFNLVLTLDPSARRGLPDNCRVLVEAGADTNARDVYGNTPIIQAAQAGCPDSIRILMEAGADPLSPDAEGVVPLLRTRPGLAREGCREIFRIFLDAGLFDVRSAKPGGTTLLMHALGTHDPEIVRRLLEAGADPNAENECGDTPIIRAAEGFALSPELEERLEILELLLDAGADPTVRNGDDLLPEELARNPEIQDRLRSAREARELGAEARPAEDLKPSRRRRLGRTPAEERTDEA